MLNSVLFNLLMNEIIKSSKPYMDSLHGELENLQQVNIIDDVGIMDTTEK